MKTLFILAIWLGVFFAVAPVRVDAQRTKSVAKASAGTNLASSGFYIRLSLCTACAPNPRKPKEENAMTTFRLRGHTAFYGVEKYNKTYDRILSLKKLSGVLSMPPYVLFVGPFQSENAAQDVASEIPTILTKQIAAHRKENKAQADAGFAIRFTSEDTTGFFEVEIVRVP